MSRSPAAAAGAAGWSARTLGLIELSFYGTGTVSGNGNASQFAIIGGLAGQNQGTVNNSHATANVTGTLVTAGGLVGYNFGTITGTNAGQTFANATISVGGDGSAGGGLVGGSDTAGSIHNANATGSVVRLAGAPDERSPETRRAGRAEQRQHRSFDLRRDGDRRLQLVRRTGRAELRIDHVLERVGQRQRLRHAA